MDSINLEGLIGLLAAAFAIFLGLAAVARKGRALASWCFLAGMVALAADALMGGLLQRTIDPSARAEILASQLITKSFFPGAWLCFSLTYCRGNADEFVARWRWAIWLAFIVPPAVAIAGKDSLAILLETEASGAGQVLVFGRVAQILMAVLLVFSVLILVNLEKTFRAAVGTVRWRFKYLFIGAGLIFGVRIYTLSQGVLLSGFNPSMTTVNAAALLLGGLLISVAYVRRGFGDLDIYPSRTVLQGSITIILAGGYLVVVGILAQVVVFLGMPEGFPAKAFIVLVGVAGLAVLLLSDRVRTSLQRQITRHFRRPQHDSRAIWTKFTRSTFGVMDRESLCRAASEVVSGAFDMLTVRVFLLDADEGSLTVVASTFDAEAANHAELPGIDVTEDLLSGLEEHQEPFVLDFLKGDWADALREASPSQFPHGGKRLGVPLRTVDRLLGVMVLSDRVKGMNHTQEDLDLLGCLGDQLAASLLNLRLMADKMESKEIEAFQTMSTFFVHDLKNAANSLGLMLQNLPVHFDDPEFRKDALRGLGAAADRINKMIARLSSLRSKLQPELTDCDFNRLVSETLDGLSTDVEVGRDLQAVPEVRIDREQIRSVLTNLVVNASEASGGGGEVRVGTARRNGHLVMEVSDEGSGMSREFIRDSLFRPFQSTKSKGLGIGMFQSKMIVEAHRGTIEVESELGKGTIFRVLLPIQDR